MLHQPTHNETPDFEFPCLDEQFRFHFASEFRDRGWSCIPLRGKKPALESWKEFQARRPTLGEVAAWFGQATKQQHNVGIVTGRVSGLAVIDCDSASDMAYWLDNFPASPLMVQTGTGGLHIYYQLPDGVAVGNRIRVFDRKIDVRGEGGYVVAPPSRHPNGNLYCWTTWGAYSLDDVPIFDPGWIDDGRAARRELRATFPRAPISRNIDDVRTRIDQIFSISGSGGHSSCFHVACLLFEAGLSKDEALLEIVRWSESGRAQPAWSLHELEHKITDAQKKVLAQR